jgi:hypothetical protein
VREELERVRADAADAVQQAHRQHLRELVPVRHSVTLFRP